MTTISHRLKILRRYFILYIKEKTVFKSDAILSVFDFFISIMSTLVFWLSIKGMGVKFDGWGVEEISLMVGFNMVSLAVSEIFFGFRDLEYKIISGEFDVMMTKGLSPFAILVLSRMNFIYILLNAGLGLAIIIYSFITYNLSAYLVLLALTTSIFATLTLQFMYNSFSLLAFKLGEIYYIRDLTFSFLKAKSYPTDIFPKGLYKFFIYIIPLALMSTLPTKIAFARVDYKIYLLVSFLSFVLMKILFKIFAKKAMSLYSGAGN